MNLLAKACIGFHRGVKGLYRWKVHLYKKYMAVHGFVGVPFRVFC